MDYNETFHVQNVGHFFKKMKTMDVNQTPSDLKPDDLESKLHENVRAILVSRGVDEAKLN